MNNKTHPTMRRIGLAVLASIAVSSSVSAAPLEEIIVTAQKRTESLQDVSISITTLDGGKIEEAGINSFNDLSAYVPNLMVSENAVATSITMRGVGPGASQSFEQSVGLYVDGIHLAKGRQFRTGLFDLERVEVLRGPQGILFGKNTLAGAVNVTSATAQVGEELSGKISLSMESNDGHTVEGNLSGSLTDNLAVRVAYKDREAGGYLQNSITGVDGPTADESLWRIGLTWQPTDNLSVKLKHSEGDFTREGGSATLRLIDPTPNLMGSARLTYGANALFFPQVAENVANGVVDLARDGSVPGGLALAQSLGRDLDRTTEKTEGTFTENKDTSLNIEYELDNGYTLTSVTGLTEYEYEDGIDVDFAPIRFGGRADISEYDQKSQEFRLASDPTQKFSFITGAYIEEQHQAIDRTVIFDGTLGLPGFVQAATGHRTLFVLPEAIRNALGLPLLNGVTSFDQAGRVSRWVQDTESWAVFFQGEYQLTDSLTLTAGVRYTEEEKRAVASTRITTDTTGLATPNGSPLLAAIFRGVTANTYDHDYDDTRKTDQVTPAVSLEWSQSDDNLYYASYSEGFKSGGFNSVDDQAPDLSVDPVAGVYTTPGDGWRYEDETAKSLEIGGKHTLLDGSMTFNWALFTSQYDNQQVSTFVGTGFVVANAASSDVNGLEVDLLWQATDNLKLGANVALLDASYGDFPSAGCTALQDSATNIAFANAVESFDGCVRTLGADGQYIANQNLAGQSLTHSPEYSGALSADYSRSVGKGDMQWYMNVDVNFTDSYLLTGDLDPLDSQEGFEKINVRTGLRGENWDVMLYGKNITDEITASGGFDVPLAAGSHAIYTDSGEIYGVRVSFNF